MRRPAADAAPVAAFAREHGLPVVIKAAAGGGGKGVAVAWSAAEIPDACARVMRASVAAGGRAECFAERYLAHARHLEVQCLADADAGGGVAVLSTADGGAVRPGDRPVCGHALQFRIYAEDPARGFAPAAGTVRTWRPPSGPGLRPDSGTDAGSVDPARPFSVYTGWIGAAWPGSVPAGA
jgi:acetyl/propionyl-CoA carboxylase alpha subunit